MSSVTYTFRMHTTAARSVNCDVPDISRTLQDFLEIDRLPLPAHVSGTVFSSVRDASLSQLVLVKYLKSHLLGLGTCDV